MDCYRPPGQLVAHPDWIAQSRLGCHHGAVVRLRAFSCDVTPPIGHPLCAGWYPPAHGIGDPLSAVGVVLLPDRQPPLVLCALDFAGLSNGDYDRWRAALAAAVGRAADRVAVHCVHPHDTLWLDRDAPNLLDADSAAWRFMAPAAA